MHSVSIPPPPSAVNPTGAIPLAAAQTSAEMLSTPCPPVSTWSAITRLPSAPLKDTVSAILNATLSSSTSTQ
ncbi:unnamed protein product [Strongylus vulgaris]|uniref:Uncharacterized protein n=1 Tax=Strongylus vulgaris TaxID=40348 RepID=A0A3P7J865_STRVU|nr:unnamed protein product [Strongylus vulgaris]